MAKKSADKIDLSKNIELARIEIEKKYGLGAILRMDEKPRDVPIIPTPSLYVNRCLGIGGFPVGRICEIYGVEQCLDSETFIPYAIKDMNGKNQNSKGGSIKRLFHRFHQIPYSGQGSYQRKQTLNSEFFLSSINESGHIIRNKIVNVFDRGENECYEVTTEGGYKIVCTSKHRFLTENDYLELCELKPGQILYVHNGTPFTKNDEEKAKRRKRKEYLVKYHPNPDAGIKIIDGKYRFVRVKRARAVLEASLNNLNLDDYINRLNSGQIEGLRYISNDQHIHHINEDTLDDSVGNLMILSYSEHRRTHSLKEHNNLRFIAIKDTIKSIIPIGLRQTFDIEMEAPYNNYIASNFVVHNSGKTTLATSVLVNAQKKFPDRDVAIIDAEHTYDMTYAENMGLDLTRVWIAQPGTAEEALEIMDRLIQSGGFSCVMLDSTGALVTAAELEGSYDDTQVGTRARLLAKSVRRISGLAVEMKTTVIFISQMRANIQFMSKKLLTTTSGHQLAHAATIRIGMVITEKLKKTADNSYFGNKVKVSIDKNKLAPPHRTCEIFIYYGMGIVKEAELIELGAEFGFIEKTGHWHTINGNKFAGTAPVIKYLVENKEYASDLENKILEKMKESEKNV